MQGLRILCREGLFSKDPRFQFLVFLPKCVSLGIIYFQQKPVVSSHEWALLKMWNGTVDS